MSITIIKAGLLDTIQSTGRYGYAGNGINPGGAMDRLAARVANMLVGNEGEEAVLEIHFPGPQVLFEQNAFISITGADFTPTLNEEVLPLWQPLLVRKNTVLHFTGLKEGARAYLAVHAGFAASKWLNSYSTNLKAGMGGWHGRKLEKADELPFHESKIYFPGLFKSDHNTLHLPWRAAIQHVYEPKHEIAFIAGNEWPALTHTSQQDFINSNFIIHPFSDRMGYQLRGPALSFQEKMEHVSSAVSYGTVQLLPGEQLIVLMADHQTTGGYPRVGHVVTAHLPKLAQLRPSDVIHFNPVNIATAEAMLFAQEQELQILQRSCHDNLSKLLCHSALI